MKLRQVGADALILYLGEAADPGVSALVQAAVHAIEHALGEHLVDLVPSYASVLIIFDSLCLSHVAAARAVRAAVADLQSTQSEGNSVTLPVYYAPEVGEDLDTLARRAGLSAQEVIDLHSGREYRVYAIGFAPGFAYLGEVDERIATPRLDTPRDRVPRGAVAIADRQTAVYPAPSPGGWNLIGRCPVAMFDADAAPHMPVAVGDRVRFTPIDRDSYLELGGVLP